MQNRSSLDVVVASLMLLAAFLPAAQGASRGLGGGVGGAVFSSAGNLELSRPCFEGDIWLSYGDSAGNEWRLGVNLIAPDAVDSARVSSVRLPTIWLGRAATVNIKRQQINLAAGLGIGLFDDQSRVDGTVVGTLGYRLDALYTYWSWQRWRAGVGLSYRGGVLGDTGYHLDRFIPIFAFHLHP